MTDLDDRIPELLARIDLAALVTSMGGVEVKRSGSSITYRCPHPSHEDRNPSFTVKDGRWKCWSVCAAGGDAIDLLCWLKGYTKAEAIADLAATVGLDRQRVDTTRSVPSLAAWCAGRGWGPWVIEELGLTLVDDRYGRQRVRFPFRLGDQVPYWQDRAVKDSVTVRWLSPKGRKPIPYEADRLRLARERGHVFVVEGVTDVVALVDTYTAPAVVGIPGVQAWQRTWAKAFGGLSVYVIADNDQAGEQFRARLADDLRPVVRDLWQVFVPTGYGDVAAWRKGLDAERFDAEMMAAVTAAAGHHVEMAG